jgi:long-chain acyl-CoA synthetase
LTEVISPKNPPNNILDEKYQWYTLDQVMKSGKDTPQPYREAGLEDIYTFSYTSGTTGEPKGAMLSHKNILTMVRATSKLAAHDGEMRYLSYLPLAHVYERVVMNVVLWRGGKYGIFGGNVFDLKTDLGILQPTVFASVPRLYNRFYDVIKQGMASATGVAKYILDTAIAAKFEKLRSTGSPTHALFDKIVFEKMRQALGGKVQIAITASAPIDASVLEFLKIAFCCPVVEAYGQTEGSGGEFSSARYDPIMGHVGGPSVCNEFKIKSVPEMKYTAEDLDEQGRLLPRGEICVRGSNVIPAYYKNEEKTLETIDEEGWLCSGDIGMILPGSNALKIFDRKKNIFKLAQGEYVAPEKLENALKMCTTVADIYVYGDSLQASLIAVLNCDEKVLTGLATAAGITGTWEELCVNPEVKKIVADDLAAQSKIAKFKGFEMVRKFEIDSVLFKDHDLLTETHKVKRNEAKIFYKDRLDAMYAK